MRATHPKSLKILTHSMKNTYLNRKILKNAISLEQYGLSDLAWNKKNALNLIQDLMKENIGILGGDVYRLSSANRLEPFSDNWSCVVL